MVNLLGRPIRRWQLVVAAISMFALILGIIFYGQLASPLVESRAVDFRGNGSRITKFVPRQSPLVASLDTQVLTRSPSLGTKIVEHMSQASKSLLDPLDINFSEDIQPWLGGRVAFSIANKDLDRNPLNGRQVGYLLVADAMDGERLREFVELFWQRQALAGIKPTLTQSNGVPIISGTVVQGEQPLAMAVVGATTLLMANDVRVVSQSLRIAQAPSLQMADCCGAIGLSVQIPELMDWLGLGTFAGARLALAPRWQHLMAMVAVHPQRLGISAKLTALDSKGFNTDGRQASSIIDFDVAVDPDSENSLGQFIPATVAWAAVGHDFWPIGRAVKDEFSRYQSLPVPVQRGQRWLSTQLAQTLSDPLADLLAGDYAVSQLVDGSWLLAIANATAVTVDRLDDIAQQQGLTVGRLMLNDRAVTAWSRLQTRVGTEAGNRETTVETDIVALHTRVGDTDLFATSLDALTLALGAKPSLVTNDTFRRTVKPMTSFAQGYAYGSWTAIEELLKGSRWFSLVEPMVQPWSQFVDAIAIASDDQTSAQLTGTVSISLKN